jgi:probable HAF family extracellular repeat protein
MRRILQLAPTILVLGCCAICVSRALAIEYRLTDLGPIVTVSRFSSLMIRATRGESINELGEVAGWSTSKGSEVQAILYRGSWVDLGQLPDVELAPGFELSYPNDLAFGVNRDGRVAGTAYDYFRQSSRAFVYDGAAMSDLGTIGGGLSEGRDINSAGHVTGWSTIAPMMASVVHAFLHDGTMHDLGTLGGTSSRGYGINDLGQTTGSSQITGDAAEHAFFHDGTMMHDLGTLGGANSYGQDINIHGHVTGYSDLVSPSGEQHAFWYDGDTMHDLGTLGGDYSAGFGINAHGHIVGDYGIDYGNPDLLNPTRAFLYTSETGMIDLNSVVDLPAGWTLQSAHDINDAGQITGAARVSGSSLHAFVLTPVPEPSTFVLAAVLAVGWITGRRRWGAENRGNFLRFQGTARFDFRLEFRRSRWHMRGIKRGIKGTGGQFQIRGARSNIKCDTASLSVLL